MTSKRQQRWRHKVTVVPARSFCSLSYKFSADRNCASKLFVALFSVVLKTDRILNNHEKKRESDFKAQSAMFLTGSTWATLFSSLWQFKLNIEQPITHFFLALVLWTIMKRCRETSCVAIGCTLVIWSTKQFMLRRLDLCVTCLPILPSNQIIRIFVVALNQ